MIILLSGSGAGLGGNERGDGGAMGGDFGLWLVVNAYKEADKVKSDDVIAIK